MILKSTDKCGDKDFCPFKKYEERYFYRVKEVEEILNTTWFLIVRAIEKNRFFAVKIGLNWRIFLDIDIENGIIENTHFHIPEYLTVQDIADILFLSEESAKKYVLKNNVLAMPRKIFVEFLYENSNFGKYKRFIPKIVQEKERLAEMVSVMVPQQ